MNVSIDIISGAHYDITTDLIIENIAWCQVTMSSLNKTLQHCGEATIVE